MQQRDGSRSALRRKRRAEQVVPQVPREIGVARIAGRAARRRQVAEADIRQHARRKVAETGRARLVAEGRHRVQAVVVIRVADRNRDARVVEVGDRAGRRHDDRAVHADAGAVHRDDAVVEGTREGDVCAQVR